MEGESLSRMSGVLDNQLDLRARRLTCKNPWPVKCLDAQILGYFERRSQNLVVLPYTLTCLSGPITGLQADQCVSDLSISTFVSNPVS